MRSWQNSQSNTNLTEPNTTRPNTTQFKINLTQPNSTYLTSTAWKACKLQILRINARRPENLTPENSSLRKFSHAFSKKVVWSNNRDQLIKSHRYHFQSWQYILKVCTSQTTNEVVNAGVRLTWKKTAGRGIVWGLHNKNIRQQQGYPVAWAWSSPLLLHTAPFELLCMIDKQWNDKC